MDCQECRRMLDLLAQGKLTKDKLPVMREHLQGCAECRRRWTDLKSRMSPSRPAASMDEDLTGKTLAGHKIVEVAGRGGMGTVYRAIQLRINREVALKVLSKQLSSDNEYVKRFIREAKMAASVNHPNLITPLDAGEVGGVYYFTMEYIHGATVSEILKKKGPYEPGVAVEIALQVARALRYAHEKGMVHRDVKPENIMIDSDGNVKLTDMGLAKKVVESAEGGLTAAGQAVGTPYYMSPEQVTHARDVDFRSDIYSLGATLYSMVTGKPPFKGQTSAAIMANVVYGNLTFPRAPQVPVALVKMIRKMMQKKAAKRYSSMARVVETLEGLLDTGLQERRRKWEEAVAPRPSARNRMPLVLAAAAGAVIIVIILVVAFSGGGPEKHPDVATGPHRPVVVPPEPIPPEPQAEEPQPPPGPRREVPTGEARDEFRKALEFDSQHSNSEFARRMELFANVFRGYPGSQFAKHAQEKYDKIKAHVEGAASAAISAAEKEENFGAKLAKLSEFLKKYAGTEQASHVKETADRVRETLTRRFKTDMARSADLVKGKKLNEAQKVLDAVIKYATADLAGKARRQKESLASLQKQLEKEKADLAARQAYAQLTSRILPHMANFNFSKALSICRAVRGEGRIAEVFASEKMDIKILTNLGERLNKKLSELASSGEIVELRTRDGQRLKGALEYAGGPFVIDRRHVVDMKKLSNTQILELAGSEDVITRAKEKVLLYTYSGGVLYARTALQLAREKGLPEQEVKWYEFKLSVISEVSGAQPPPKLADRSKTSEKTRPEEKSPAPKETVEHPEGPRKLFNGRNLDGFRADQKIFGVNKKHAYANHTRQDAPAHLLWETPVQGDFTFSVKLIIEARHGRNTSFGGGAAPMGAGIVFGHDKSQDTCYRFWTEIVYGERGWIGLTGGRFGSTTGRSAHKDWVELKVEVKNKFLRTFYNGEEVNAESFSSYKGGRIGVYVHQCAARFKDFILHTEETAGKETPAPVAEAEKADPRQHPVAKKVLEKLALIAPEGFVAVPAGEFLMGTVEPRPPRDDTRPQHKVYLDTYFVKKYEVTQKEYKRFIDGTGAPPPSAPSQTTSRWAWRDGTYPPGTDNTPVVLVTWNECMKYCKWLGAKMGRPCSMPTEAQWEKAATWNFVKGGKHKYPWGNRPPEPGWVKEPSRSGGGYPVGGNPHDVCFCGCYGMLGNVVEYCLDVYDDEYYKKSQYKNPRGPKWPPEDRDHHTHRGSSHLGLTGRTWGGDGGKWRGWIIGFRVVIEPTEKENLLIQKILETKGEFDVKAYLDKLKQERLANYHKHLFAGSCTRKGDSVKLNYTFNKRDHLKDWVFAHDVTKPHKLSSDTGIWDVLEKERCFSGGGKAVVLSKAVFAGDATFEVELKMRNVKNLVLMVASQANAEAAAACFGIDEREEVFASDYVKNNLKQGFRNLIFRLEEGRYAQFMMTCNNKELTIKNGIANCSGKLVTAVQVAGSDLLNKVKAHSLSIGGAPTGSAPKKELKARKKLSFTVKVIEGFALFYMGRDFLGFTLAPKGGYRFGIAAYNSFVDMNKAKLSGKIDEQWLKKEAEK